MKVSKAFSWSKDPTTGTSIDNGALSAAVFVKENTQTESCVLTTMKRGSLKKISLRETPTKDTSSMGDMAVELTEIEHTDVDRIFELARKVNPLYETSLL